MKKWMILLGLLLGLTACDRTEEESSLVENPELVYVSEVSPNAEYIENEMDKVIFTVQVYQDEKNRITVNADSNSAFFDEVQYEIMHNAKISKADVAVTWTTLMGNSEATEEDQLAVADIAISSNGEVFSERKVNFVKGGIEIIVDVINKNIK